MMLTFFKTIGSFFKRCYRWCRKNTALTWTVIGGILIVAVYIFLRKGKDAIEVARLLNQIARQKIKITDIKDQIHDLKVKKAVLEEKDTVAVDKVAVIDKKLEKLDRDLVDYKNSVKTMSDSDVLSAFEDLGY